MLWKTFNIHSDICISIMHCNNWSFSRPLCIYIISTHKRRQKLVCESNRYLSVFIFSLLIGSQLQFILTGKNDQRPLLNCEFLFFMNVLNTICDYLPEFKEVAAIEWHQTVFLWVCLWGNFIEYFGEKCCADYIH